jgi:hypothetical protein
VFADWNALQGSILDGAHGAVTRLDAHNRIDLSDVSAADLIANHVNDFSFV